MDSVLNKVPRISLSPVKRTAILALFLFAIFIYQQTANAGTFTSAKLTISDSRASNAATTYDFAYTATVTTSIKQVDILFCTTASGTCTVPSGMTTTTAVRSSDNWAGTGRTDTFTGNGTLSTVITTPSTQSTQAITNTFTTITNPSTVNTTFFARITTYSDTGSTVIDSVTVAAAILDTTSVAVSASVDPTFTFTLAGVSTSASVNSATTNIITTATTIPLGTMSNAVPKIGAQDATVTTNAASGYTITIKATTANPLTSGSNVFSPFSGSNATATTWSSPAGTSANTNTAFFGYTTEDVSLATGTTNRFASNKWAGTTTSPLEVVYNPTGVSAQVTRIGYQAEINALQPSGSYTGTVILVATPTY